MCVSGFLGFGERAMAWAHHVIIILCEGSRELSFLMSFPHVSPFFFNHSMAWHHTWFPSSFLVSIKMTHVPWCFVNSHVWINYHHILRLLGARDQSDTADWIYSVNINPSSCVLRSNLTMGQQEAKHISWIAPTAFSVAVMSVLMLQSCRGAACSK